MFVDFNEVGERKSHIFKTRLPISYATPSPAVQNQAAASERAEYLEGDRMDHAANRADVYR